MYNFYTDHAAARSCIIKSLMIIRLSVVMLIITVFSAGAQTATKTITLNKVNVSMIEVFKAIRQQTDYDFAYSKKQISTTNKVTIKVQNATIVEVLDICFKNQILGYIIENKSILIKPKSKPTSVENKKLYLDISGKITDKQGTPIHEVSVKIKDSNKLTRTNSNGEFQFLGVNKEAEIIVSFVGFETQVISVATDLSAIVLNLSDNKLDEIQVIGYGTSTQRFNTGSTAKITAKEIGNQPVTNPLSALAGRLPGVFIQTTNGLPGGNVNVQIRGKGSITAGTNPLYIIDGVPYDGNAPVAANQRQAANYIGGTISPLNNLNPSDIETITVLKDADATSIYGSRGTNGVILITTKKAKGGATVLDINVTRGISKVSEMPRLLDLEEYLIMRREAFTNDGRTPSSDPVSVDYAPDLTIWDQTNGTDWADYIIGNTAQSTDGNLTVSGGKGNTTFSIRGNLHQENTVLPGINNYQRAGLTSQIQHLSENKKLRISFQNQLTHQDNQLTNIVSGIGGITLAPNFPLYLEDGSLNWFSGSNILASAKSSAKTIIDNSANSLNFSYQVLPKLDFKVNTGYTRTTYKQTLIFPTSAISPDGINYTDFANNNMQSFIIEPQVDYMLQVKNASFSFLAGATYQKNINDRQFIEGGNFKHEELMEDLASAGVINSRQTTYSQYKYASLFGRLTFKLDDSYIINATIRRDGSSRFGKENKFGNFGSLGAAWIFSNLRFVRDKVSFLSFGKLRASYGSTGNDQIADYQYKSTYSSPGTNLYQGIATIRPNRIGNDDFHWETTYKADIGIELGFYKDNISVNFDYYRNRSRDQLVQYTLPLITGFNGYQANLPAVIINEGLEFNINAKIVNHKNLLWSTGFNITIPKNKLKSFEDFSSSSYSVAYELGYDITRIYGYKSLGIDPQTGKAQYASENGEASPNPYFNFTVGKTSPDLYGGFSNNVSYHNWEVNIFAQFVKQVSAGWLSGVPGQGIYNTFEITKDRWSPNNLGSSNPRASLSYYDQYLNTSSQNIFNTSFLRLKNVTLSYSIPTKFLQKFNINTLKLYTQGQNLYTIWNKKTAIADPESGGSSIPAIKSLVFGIQITL